MITMSSHNVLECCIMANSIVLIGPVALGLQLEPNKTVATGQRCQSRMEGWHGIRLTHHPFHNHPKVISGLGQRSQVVQMKKGPR